jgi:hypothetical protein
MRSKELPLALPLTLLALLAMGPLAATGCLDPIPDNTITPPGTGVLSGEVRNACDKSPLAQIDVVVDKRATQTDAAGRYSLDGLPAGLHVVTYAGKDFSFQQKTVQIDDGKTTNVIVDLVPQITTLPTKPRLDVLFVVDNSGSMEQEQQALAAAFPAFIAELRDANADLRIGVISTDMGAGSYALPSCEVTGGDDGTLQVTPRIAGCKGPKDRWIATSPDGDNLDGSSAEQAFSCIVPLGIQGCGFEQPLAAVQRAIGAYGPPVDAGAVDGPPPKPSVQQPQNSGFLRDNAALAIVVLTDEDDCSAENDLLYDPSQNTIDDPLGPLTSFRCFEFGVRCDVNGRFIGPRKDCIPNPASGAPLLQNPAHIVEHLRRLKGGSPVFFALIAGPSTPVVVGLEGQNPVLRPSCQTGTGVAVPPIRLQSVVDAFAPRSSFDSICTSDLSPTLRAVAKKIVATALINTCQ